MKLAVIFSHCNCWSDLVSTKYINSIDLIIITLFNRMQDCFGMILRDYNK